MSKGSHVAKRTQADAWTHSIARRTENLNIVCSVGLAIRTQCAKKSLACRQTPDLLLPSIYEQMDAPGLSGGDCQANIKRR